jgi:AcrR family transcriptional regulator
MPATRTTKRKRGQTRTDLLEAASKVFGEKGFRDATIADICELANANIAAINYYFRSKEALYTEAWRLAFQRSTTAHPFDGGVPPTAPARQRLQGHIRCLVQRLKDPVNPELLMFHQELANPTGLLAEVMREAIAPIRQALCDVVRELLGDKASDRQVSLCELNVMSMCIHPMMLEQHRHALHAKEKAWFLPFDFGAEEMAEHIFRFSLSGINGMRRRLEGGETSDPA